MCRTACSRRRRSGECCALIVYGCCPRDYQTPHHINAVPMLMLMKAFRIAPFGRHWSRRSRYLRGWCARRRVFPATHHVASRFFSFFPEGVNRSVNTPLAGYDLQLSRGTRRSEVAANHAFDIASHSFASVGKRIAVFIQLTSSYTFFASSFSSWYRAGGGGLLPLHPSA